jgi:hypothetical protein
MKTYYESKAAYIADHIAKPLVESKTRLNALKAIEKVFKEKFPEALLDEYLFDNISKKYFSKLYECLKGTSLNGAEKSVITGLYKFSK